MNRELKPSSSAFIAKRRIWSPCLASWPGSRYEGTKTPTFMRSLLGGRGFQLVRSLARSPALEEVAACDQRVNLGVGNGAGEHPEAAVRVNVCDALRAAKDL